MRVLVVSLVAFLGTVLGTGVASAASVPTPTTSPSTPTSSVDFATAPVWPIGVLVGGWAALAFGPCPRRRRRGPMMDG